MPRRLTEDDGLGLGVGVVWTLSADRIAIDLRRSAIDHIDDLLWLQAAKASLTNGDRNTTFLTTPAQERTLFETVTDRDPGQSSDDPAVGFWARHRAMEFVTG